MTVCIGALCADADGQGTKAVVFASDRMVTLAGLTEFEHEVPKVMPVTDSIVALIAGDALRGSRLVRELRARIPANPAPVEQVVNVAAALYAQLRQQQIEGEVFAPRGITLQQFYGGIQILPQMMTAIDHHMATYNFGVDFLIGGVDDAAAHLFYLGNPGGPVSDFQTIGFTAIGSGAIHALQSMIGFAHTPARALKETVFAVYASKRRAEVAPGVGKDTDMVVIRPTGTTYIDGGALAQLEKVYQEYQRPISEELREDIARLTIMGEVRA